MTEYAAAERATMQAIRTAPAHIRRAINRARIARGLTTIDEMPRPASGYAPRVCWDPRSPHRPAGSSLRVQRTGDRAILVVAHGDAPAHCVRRDLPETIARHAFGTAEELNAEKGWGIVAPGHDGIYVALAGSSLRAVDTEVGIVLVWDLDRSKDGHTKAAAMIERGMGPSVLMRVKSRRILPGVEMVTRARLINVAIVNRPAYGGAVAKVFRDVPIDDAARLREQLASVVREAKFREHRRQGHAV